MPEFSYDKLVALVKKNKDITQGQAAQQLGLSIGQVSMLKFCQAQLAAGVYQKAPATAASVKKLRDNEGNRWELIAARTGLSPAAVKGKYEEAGGDAKSSYTGRGRNFNGASGAKPSGRKPAGRSTSKPAGRKPGAKPAARKPAGSAANRKGGKQVVRRTTRRSTAANPS